MSENKTVSVRVTSNHILSMALVIVGAVMGYHNVEYFGWVLGIGLFIALMG